MRMLQHEGSGILVELNQVLVSAMNEVAAPDYLQEVLNQYDTVFNMPKGLPLL